MFDISLANRSDLNTIEQIYIFCKEDLLARQIYQWDDTYPNRDYFENCIEDGSIYVMKDGEQLLGIVVLDECQSSEWDEIEWQGKKPLVIHSLMVHPRIKVRELGNLFSTPRSAWRKNKGTLASGSTVVQAMKPHVHFIADRTISSVAASTLTQNRKDMNDTYVLKRY